VQQPHASAAIPKQSSTLTPDSTMLAPSAYAANPLCAAIANIISSVACRNSMNPRQHTHGHVEGAPLPPRL
jgi:hypothetical protein